jgi:cytochrome c biogenesis protein CcdA
MKPVNPSTSNKLYLLLALALIAGVILVLYLLLTTFLNWFSALENQVAAAVATVSVTALISIGSLILAKRYEHKRDIRKELNAKKTPIYEELINFSLQTFLAEKAGQKQPTEEETIKFIVRLLPHNI